MMRSIRNALALAIAAGAGLVVAAAVGGAPPMARAAAAVEPPGKGFTTGVVEAGGFRVAYAEAGPRGAPVIVSLPGSAGLEMSVAKDRLAQRFRIIELQPPGWGGSAALTRDMEQAEIGRILGEAANKLVDGKYHLIGTSMGGGNALHLVAAFPDRVKSVTLEAAMAPARLSDLHTPMIERTDVKRMLQAGGPAGGYPTPPANPNKSWATPEYNRNQMAMRFRMMQWVQTDIGDAALFTKVRASGVSILALLGDRDGILKPTLQSYYKQVFPAARFVLVPGGEHDLQNTRADVFVEEVGQFIARSER